MNRTKSIGELQGVMIGFAIVIVPFLFAWPLPLKLGIAGTALAAVLGGLAFTASRDRRPQALAFVGFGVGVGLVFVSAFGAMGLLLDAVDGEEEIMRRGGCPLRTPCANLAALPRVPRPAWVAWPRVYASGREG